jgi:hypothetical protein
VPITAAAIFAGILVYGVVQWHRKRRAAAPVHSEAAE